MRKCRSYISITRDTDSWSSFVGSPSFKVAVCRIMFLVLFDSTSCTLCIPRTFYCNLRYL